MILLDFCKIFLLIVSAVWIHLVYLDSQNQEQQVEYMVKDFVPCDRLSDFINSKKIKYGKIY